MRLTDEQIEVLLKGIVASRVKSLEGMSYVESYDIRAMMNRVFGFCEWSLIDTAPAVCVYEVETQLRSGKPGWNVAYRAHLALIVHTQDGDATYAGSAVADSTMPDYKRGDAHDMALKSAESGALKRAATNLGDQFGLSLYRDGSLEPVVRRVVGFNTSPGTSAPPQSEPEEAPLADGGATSEPPVVSPTPPEAAESVQAVLDSMTGAGRVNFLRHLAMERKITQPLAPENEGAVLAAFEKWNRAA